MLASTLPSVAETRPEVKEEEDEVNRDGGKNEVLSLKSLSDSLKSEKLSSE
jgi:hypothetical protein